MRTNLVKGLEIASLVIFLLMVVPAAARGDGVLTLSSVSGTPGSTVTVFGTITNTGLSNLFLNNENFTLGSSSLLNGDPTDFFLNAPLSLTPGSNSGLIALFTFEIAPGTLGGTYGGNFLDILGGPGPSDQNLIASANFSVVVPSTPTPEPGALTLFLMGGAFFLSLRKKVTSTTRNIPQSEDAETARPVARPSV